MEKKWVEVYKFFDIFLEGQELEAILKESNIPAEIVSRDDTAFDGLFKSTIGGGVIKVREDYVEEAKRIIADFEKRKQKIKKETEKQTKALKAKTDGEDNSISGIFLGLGIIIVTFVIVALIFKLFVK